MRWLVRIVISVGLILVGLGGPRPAAAAAAPAIPCAGWLDAFRAPPTIRVAHVASGSVASVTVTPFRDYVVRMVASVTPALASPETARAIAIIVKQQAWYRAVNPREGFWKDPAACYDVRDDIDGVAADPSAVLATHVDAVAGTWSTTMRRIDLSEPFFFPYLREGGGTCETAGPGRQPIAELGSMEACGSNGLAADKILERAFGPSLLLTDTVGLGGVTRYETAVNVSNTVVPTPPSTIVYVATGTDFPDAVSAGPAAAHLGSPLLLVTPSSIPAAVSAELIRLAPSEIRIVGGPGVIGDNVARDLTTFAPSVRRIFGASRYETAVETSRATFGGSTDAVFVATGQNFPDAVAGAAAATHLGAPVLLVPGSSSISGPLAAKLAAELHRLNPKVIHVLGGPGAVSRAWEAWLRAYAPSVERHEGSDRYATSAAISRAIFAGPEPVLNVATGSQFPDALVAAPLNGPLLLVRPGLATVGGAALAEVARLQARQIVVLGTSLLIADDTVSTLARGAAPTVGNRLLGAYCCTELPGNPILDADGIPMNLYAGKAEYNPVQIAQYGLARHERWLRQGSATDLATVLHMADWLVDHQDADGLWLYTFPFGGQPVPWRSALAQGQAVSLLLRAWQESGDEDYHAAVLAAIPTMHRTLAQRGVAEWDQAGYWLEEYEPPYSHHTLNGMLLAMEGLREWVSVSGDASVDAWYRDAIRTIETQLYRYDTGAWSRYNLSGSTATTKYHIIHIVLLRHFARVALSVPMTSMANRWAGYAAAR